MRKWWLAGVLVVGAAVATPAWAQPPNGGGETGGEPMPMGGPMQPPDAAAGPMGNPGARSWGEAPPPVDGPACAGANTKVSAEFLNWWIKNAHTPPLVTTGSVTDPVPGAIGQPGTVVSFGGSIDYQDRMGARLVFDHWLSNDHALGVQFVGLYLDGQDMGYKANSDATGTALLARPFFNVNAGAQDADPVFVPGLLGGNINASLSSLTWGGEVNFLLNTCCSKNGWRIDALAGPRFLALWEKLNIWETVNFPEGTSDFLSDHFTTHNQFYGGQFGFLADCKCGTVEFGLRGKLGFGTNYKSIRIEGNGINGELGNPISTSAGLLAQPSNEGTFHRYDFSFLPEVGANIGWDIKPNLKVFVDYSFLYWTGVARPGDQIDTGVNVMPVGAPNQIGPARPSFTYHPTDFFAHGISVGLQWNF